MGFGPAGENVSLPMNISGHCAYSICNASCQIELIWAECKVGQTEALNICDPDSEDCPPTAASSATSLVPATTLAPVSDCLGLIPPRKVRDWKEEGVVLYSVSSSQDLAFSTRRFL